VIQFLLLLDGEQARGSCKGESMVTNPLRTFPIPPLDHSANPSGGIAEYCSHFTWGVAFLHKPQDMPMGPLYWVGRASVAFMMLLGCQIGGHCHSFCHAHSIHYLNGFDIIRYAALKKSSRLF
jgi:hypothetical protein